MKRRLLVILVSICILLNMGTVVYAADTYEAENAKVTQAETVLPQSAGEYSGTGYIEAANQNSKLEFNVTVL